MTALTLVTRALQLAGVIASGETATAEESADGLLTLNSLIEEWATQGLTMFTRTRVTHSLVASQASYTIGASGADITRARPPRIEMASMIDTTADPDLEIPVDVLSEDQWRDIGQKAQTSTRPLAIYYVPTFPLGTIFVWPVGTVATIQMVLYVPDLVDTLAALSTTLSLPPGYEKALRTNLALELCPEYGRIPSDVIVAMARESKANVKRANYRPVEMRCDLALLGSAGSINIRTGV